MGEKEDRFQLLNEKQEPFADSQRISQIKVDGRLVRVVKTGDEIVLIGRDYISKANFPEAVESIKKIPFSFKADAEFACFEEGGIKSNFSKLQTRSKLKDRFKIRLLSNLTPVTPVFFDLLEFDGQQIVNETYEKRKGILNEKFNFPGIKVVKDWEDPFECWKYVIANKLEGIVEKDKDAFYRTGRNNAGIKIKRKGLFEMRFNGFEINPNGITLFNAEGFRCNCAGSQSIPVKEQLNKFGVVNVIVRGMADKTENGRIREIVFHSFR